MTANWHFRKTTLGILQNVGCSKAGGRELVRKTFVQYMCIDLSPHSSYFPTLACDFF